ncbi:unnamed protein product (macronuclear) [Paramecium tetraurelia]|uniref:Calponin-homology (CH) domain-containing protein n=1 Tax=Paramecium tetraurelia TaxID=5888 RepID=A0BIY9_PARTE|nr:uncharacterized protein GSPATT00004879001 [Paramecium tetraurelia]CAK58506.1 unnamed protein product [Paramecium tetraurelia]|eukprot:XP_001425904.1 hypothetical protein (macronuclear) [Paramecium tetraurelia strain d4-2]
MQESVSAYMKTEPDSLREHPPSKFKQNMIQNNQRILNGKKVTYLNIKKQNPSNQKDAWKQMFGNFLHDINLKQKKKHFSPEAKQHLQDPLVNEIPILLPCTNKQFKLEFYKYLEGEQSIQQLMKAINFPHVHAVRLFDIFQNRNKLRIQKVFRENCRLCRRSKSLRIMDQLKLLLTKLLYQISIVQPDNSKHIKYVWLIKGDLLKLENYWTFLKPKQTKRFRFQETSFNKEYLQIVILQIDLRKSLNKEQREEEIRNIHFIKTFFDITNDYNQHIQQQQDELKDDAQYYKKLVPCQRKLKQLLVNYDNVQPIIKHQEKHFDKFDYPSLGMLKNQMNQYSKDYLMELEQQKQIQFKLALNQVRKLLEQQNIKFQSELRKSKIKSNQNSKSQSPLLIKQQQDQIFQTNSKMSADCALDVVVASPKHHRNQYQSVCQLKDSISDPRKRKQYVITKKPFYLFTQQVEGNKNSKNSKGLITNFDVKLYDYIHNRNIYTLNKQVKEMTQKFHTMVESEHEQQLNEQLDTHLNQLKNRKLKFRQHGSLEAQKRVQTERQADEISDDQSLQSIYEVNLDVLYDQSNQLTKKLREKNDAGFAKRIKQLIRLEEVNSQASIIYFQVMPENKFVEAEQILEFSKQLIIGFCVLYLLQNQLVAQQILNYIKSKMTHRDMDAPPLNEDELNEIYNWVDTIPLSRPKRHIGRDFADGVLMAEIVQHYIPRIVDIHNYSLAHSVQQKQYNWNTLNTKVFRKMGFQITQKDIDAVIAVVPEAVERILKVVQVKISMFLDNKEQNQIHQQEKTIEVQQNQNKVNNKQAPNNKQNEKDLIILGLEGNN